jgi:hypothetical protein
MARLIRPLAALELRKEIHHFLGRVQEHLSNRPGARAAVGSHATPEFQPGDEAWNP